MKSNPIQMGGKKKGKVLCWVVAIFSLVCLLNSIPRDTFTQDKYPSKPINFVNDA